MLQNFIGMVRPLIIMLSSKKGPCFFANGNLNNQNLKHQYEASISVIRQLEFVTSNCSILGILNLVVKVKLY